MLISRSETSTNRMKSSRRITPGVLNTAKEAVTLEKNEDTAAARAETNRVRQEQQDTREKYLDLKQQQLDGQMRRPTSRPSLQLRWRRTR